MPDTVHNKNREWVRLTGDDCLGHHEVVDFMYRYWCEKHTAFNKPSRSDISPSHFKKFLPHIGLLDVVAGDPCDFHVRLCGTEIAYYLSDSTGNLISQHPIPEASQRVIRTGNLVFRKRFLISVCLQRWMTAANI